MGEWISVNDSLPEFDVDVQVYCTDTKEQMVGFISEKLPHGLFQFAEYRGTKVVCEPTHWMPLPEPPNDPN
jgi:hypothetical protein